MAIEGKKPYKLYLDEKNVSLLQCYLDKKIGSGGISGLVDKYLARCAFMVKENKDSFDSMSPGKMTLNNFFQLCKVQVKMQKDWKDKSNDSL